MPGKLRGRRADLGDGVAKLFDGDPETLRQNPKLGIGHRLGIAIIRIVGPAGRPIPQSFQQRNLPLGVPY
jgi:hypothetical protein